VPMNPEAPVTRIRMTRWLPSAQAVVDRRCGGPQRGRTQWTQYVAHSTRGSHQAR
jgi:hypothetical protein